MSRSDVSVVVVNFNGGDYIEECLRSVPEGVPLVVVDNGSRDGSPDRIAERFPKVRLVRSPVNGGFARAVNQGIAASAGRHVLLLNPDARLAPGVIEALAGHLDANPGTGMIAPQLLHEDGRPQHSFDALPSLATAFLNKSLLRLLWPSRFPSKRQAWTAPVEVESVIGACMMVRRSLIERIGGLDEQYFLFLEETDWCLRARRAGAAVVFHPGVKVVHLQGRAKDKVRVRARIEYTRSLFAYFRKNRPGQSPWLRLLQPLKNLVELVAGLPTLLGAKGRRRWLETGALLGWQLAGAPPGWGLSTAREAKWIRMRDGTWVLESRMGDFNRFDERGRERKLLEEMDGKRRLLYTPEAGRSYLVKVYKPRGLAALKGRIFGGKPSHERAMCLGLLDRGIPCAPVVAIRDAESEPWLAVEWLDGARTVQEVLLDPATAAAPRRALLGDYGRFVRRLFDSGVWQYDFNPTNVLLHEGRLVLIDFERMKLFPGRTPERERVYLLSKMNRLEGPSRTDRLRFVRAFLDADAGQARSWKGVVRRILERHRAQRDSDADRLRLRCLEDNRDFGVLEGPAGRLHYRKRRPEREGGLTPDEASALLAGGKGPGISSDGRKEDWIEACVAGRAPLALLVPKDGSPARIWSGGEYSRNEAGSRRVQSP